MCVLSYHWMGQDLVVLSAPAVVQDGQGRAQGTNPPQVPSAFLRHRLEKCGAHSTSGVSVSGRRWQAKLVCWSWSENVRLGNSWAKGIFWRAWGLVVSCFSLPGWVVGAVASPTPIPSRRNKTQSTHPETRILPNPPPPIFPPHSSPFPTLWAPTSVFAENPWGPSLVAFVGRAKQTCLLPTVGNP